MSAGVQAVADVTRDRDAEVKPAGGFRFTRFLFHGLERYRRECGAGAVRHEGEPHPPRGADMREGLFRGG